MSDATLIAGRYRLDRHVATDRFGEVWQGTDVELARPVAVKLLNADAGGDAASQFRAAARRTGSLTHEGIVRVFDYCEPDPAESAQRPFLVMEYVEGQSLATQLRAGPLGTAGTIDILAQISAALEVVHRAGLVHGNMRPEKILLRPDGAVKLLGFSGTCSAGPAAIGAELHALGILGRECLGDPTAPLGSGPLAGQFPDSVAGLVAELCALESADQPDATAAIARRAAALRAQLRKSAAHVSATGRVPAARHVPAPHGGLTPSRRGRVAAVRTSAVIAAAVAAVTLFGALRPFGGAPRTDDATKAASVRVTAAQLIGRPVSAARTQLQRLGLTVRIQWRSSDSVSSGDVVAVRPVGLVPAHSVVVIVGSSGPATTGAVGHKGQTARSSPHPSKPRSPGRSPASPAPSLAASPSPASSPTPSPSLTSSPAPSPSASVSPQ